MVSPSPRRTAVCVRRGRKGRASDAVAAEFFLHKHFMSFCGPLRPATPALEDQAQKARRSMHTWLHIARAGLAPAALRSLHSCLWPHAQCRPPCSALQYATALHAEHTLNSRTVTSFL